jgi:glycosyltransferase involved in cell wall biosynthesis
MANGKPIILLSVRYFLPAYKSGGPVRTLQALVENLSAIYQFKILAFDRDDGDPAPFASIRKNEWNRMGQAQVRYLSPGWAAPSSLISLLRDTEFDVLYLNSFFDPVFTLAPLLARRLGLIPANPIVIAPRGEFSAGALAQKPLKKAIFLRLERLLGFYKNTVLHASTEREKGEIQRALGGGQRGNGRVIRVALNMSLNPTDEIQGQRQAKVPGQLKAVFVSRVAAKKNLLAAIEIMAAVKGDVSFHIYGPLGDWPYWEKCQRAMRQSGASIRVEYKGALAHEKVLETLGAYDVFVLPTLGENFGHVILESLLAGCPVVISDQTPWRGLREKKAGWDLPLQAPERFVEVLQRVVEMKEEDHQMWRQGARALGVAVARDAQVLNDNKNLFVDLPGTQRGAAPKRVS